MGVVATSFLYLWRQFGGGQRLLDWSELNIHFGYGAVALALAVICLWLGGWAWQLVLQGLGQSLTLPRAVWIHCLANLAKYVPGYAWQLVGKVYLTRQQGISAKMATLAMGIEYLGLMATGALVALLFWPLSRPAPVIGVIGFWIRIPSAALVLAALALGPRLLAALVLRKESPSTSGSLHLRLRWGSLLLAWLIMTVAWILLGLGLVALVASVQPFPIASWSLVISALATSFLISLVVLFVPGGIGIRESIIATILSLIVAGSTATLVALTSRVVFVLAELLGFALIWMGRWLVGHNQSITQRG